MKGMAWQDFKAKKKSAGSSGVCLDSWASCAGNGMVGMGPIVGGTFGGGRGALELDPLQEAQFQGRVPMLAME
jgi:hypothetical protein